MASTDVVRDTGTTLVALLRAAIPSFMVPADRIVVATPDEFEAFSDAALPGITLFLYRLGVNPQMRNGPRRQLPDGRSARPLLPLELGYMITAWAGDAEGEHRILGRVMQAFYEHAEIGSSELQGDSWAPGDSVQLVLDSMPIEDHFRLWDSVDLPYQLSLTYVARVVGIEPATSEQLPPVVEAEFIGPPP
jgi:hypothetical protein